MVGALTGTYRSSEIGFVERVVPSQAPVKKVLMQAHL